MLNLNELLNEFACYAKKYWALNDTQIIALNNLLSSDPIHHIDAYMSEYDGEILINNQTYKRYHCWFSNHPDFPFEHFTYYAIQDLYDESVEAYIAANKYYEII